MRPEVWRFSQKRTVPKRAVQFKESKKNEVYLSTAKQSRIKATSPAVKGKSASETCIGNATITVPFCTFAKRY